MIFITYTADKLIYLEKCNLIPTLMISCASNKKGKKLTEICFIYTN